MVDYTVGRGPTGGSRSQRIRLGFALDHDVVEPHLFDGSEWFL